MDNKSTLVLIISLLAISMIVFVGIGTNSWWHLQENNSTDTESIEKQLEHLQNIRMDVDRVFMEDEKARDLIDGKEYLKTLEIIHNESYVEDFYRIGFQYKKLEECRGYRVVGGKIYKFNIDLSNKTVLSVEEAENQTPDVGRIKGDKFMDGAYTTTRSSVFMRFSDVWMGGSQWWLYEFRVGGNGEVRLKPNPSMKALGWGCFKHHLAVEKVYNKENFFFNIIENDPKGKKAGCKGDKLPRFESRRDRESITCAVITYPREEIKPHNWPSNANFSYYWQVWVKPNQTIMFDVAVKLDSIENARDTYGTNHKWRVIITSPPSPNEMSLAEMKEHGIECAPYGTYAHNPVIIVKGEPL